MTDDITHGLALLADEAEPAPIDSHAVIARARARTRNRRATFATVAVVGALAVTMGTLGASGKTATTVATAPEKIADKLNRSLTEALPDLIPSNWSLVREQQSQDPPLTFRCDVNVLPASEGVEAFRNGCLAYAIYNDGVGEIQVHIAVHRLAEPLNEFCEEPHCTLLESPGRRDLPDGTKTLVTTYADKTTPRDIQNLLASRPDGTHVSVSVIWPQRLRSTSLTMDEILKFATIFTYGPDDVPPATDAPKTDPEQAARLTGELTAVLATAIPAGWSPAPEIRQYGPRPLSFDCREGTMGPGTGDGTPENDPPTMMACWTYANYQDAAGTIGFKFSVSPRQIFGGTCESDCAVHDLSDGTRTHVKEEYHAPIAEYTHSVTAFRPDGTVIWVEVFWQGERPRTPLTTEQLLRFATAFTY